MTVAKLIAALQQLPPDLPVVAGVYEVRELKPAWQYRFGDSVWFLATTEPSVKEKRSVILLTGRK